MIVKVLDNCLFNVNSGTFLMLLYPDTPAATLYASGEQAQVRLPFTPEEANKVWGTLESISITSETNQAHS